MTRSKYTGVAFNKLDGKWRARFVRNDGKRVWVSESFESEEQAARAYDSAVKSNGLKAQALNFPDGSGFTPPTFTNENEKRKREQVSESNGVENDEGWETVTRKKKRVERSQGDESSPAVVEKDVEMKSEAAKTFETSGKEDKKETPEETEKSDSEATKTKKKKKKKDKKKKNHQASAAPKPPIRPRVELPEVSFPIRYPVVIPEPSELARFHRAVGIMYNTARFEMNYKQFLLNIEKDKSKWAFTTDSEVEESSVKPKLFALDCEMVMCKDVDDDDDDGSVATLARVSLLECVIASGEEKPSLSFNKVLDEIVHLPEGMKVVDYVSDVSGITEEVLQKASSSADEVRAKILQLVNATDIIAGHTLWSDFEALKIWHGNFLDSAVLCGVKNFPKITLSLKDIVGYLFEMDGNVDVEQFQKHGEAHDSLIDAEYACRALHLQLSMHENVFDTIPLEIPSIPNRLKCRLTFCNIPDSCGMEHLNKTLQNVIESREAKSITFHPFHAREIKWRVRKDGSKVGSCALDFQTATEAEFIFKHVKPASSGCGGYANSGACYKDGYPDNQGLLRKLIVLASLKKKDKETFHCEVNSHLPIFLGYKKYIPTKASQMGLVVGKYGRTLTMIQQVTGTRVQISRQPDRKSTDLNLAESGEFLIEADSIPKLYMGEAMVLRALSKSLTL